MLANVSERYPRGGELFIGLLGFAGAMSIQFVLPALGRIFDEAKHIAGINKVRVDDVGVDVPDLGPEPWVPEERRGDIPERVANLDDIFVWVALGQRHGLVDTR